jgi:hypothetical protein
MTQSALTPLPAPPGRVEHERARQADHNKVHHIGHVGDRRIRTYAADRLAVAVDRVRRADEVGSEQVPEELTADRATPPRRADHGDRARLEERAERGGHREVVALVDPRPVLLGRLDREADLELAAVQLPRHLEPGALEDAQHGRVVQLNVRDEALDPLACGESRETLEQPGADAAALQIVRDREGGLGGGGIAQAVVLADRNDPPLPVAVRQRADEDAAVAPVGLEEVHDELLVNRADSMEALVKAPFGQSSEERGEGACILPSGRPQPEGRAVAEDDVDRGGRSSVRCRDRQAQRPFLSARL